MPSFFPYRTARKDNLTSHKKVHTSDQTLNRECRNETKTQFSSKKFDLLKELPQQPFNLKQNISHQDPIAPSKYPRQENIIDPVDNEQSLNYIKKQENKDHAFVEFSQQYREPWSDDEQLKQLYKIHMKQIKDQEIKCRRSAWRIRKRCLPYGIRADHFHSRLRIFCEI